MPKIEVFENDEETSFFVGTFDFLPRLGETVSKNMGGYFSYYDVVEVWHREDDTGIFRACIRVKLDD